MSDHQNPFNHEDENVENGHHKDQKTKAQGEQAHEHSADHVSANTTEALKNTFGKTSKVVNNRYGTVKKWTTYGIMGIGVMVVLMIFLGHHHNEESKKEKDKQNKVATASALLAKRLAELREEKKNGAMPAARETPSVRETGAYSKELIARMNAPTSLYEGGNNAAVASSSTSSAAQDSKNVPEATFIGKGADQAFGNTAYQTTSVDAKQVPHPEATIVSGEMIHATLNVATNSDLPGMVTATVTSPAYSYTGENELIPRGSRLIGQYSSAVLQGQDRIFIMWNRLVLPNGTSVDINSPDTDQIGQAGEPADYVNRHFWSRFGESILLSILSAGVSNVDVQSSDQYNSAQAYRMGIADSLQASATGSLQQTISLKPTLVRYQGSIINVFIAHDLSFYNLMQQTGQVE